MVIAQVTYNCICESFPSLHILQVLEYYLVLGCCLLGCHWSLLIENSHPPLYFQVTLHPSHFLSADRQPWFYDHGEVCPLT